MSKIVKGWCIYIIAHRTVNCSEVFIESYLFSRAERGGRSVTGGEKGMMGSGGYSVRILYSICRI